MTDKLTMRWSKRERDLVINYPSKPDGHLTHIVFNCERTEEGVVRPIRRVASFVDELKARGYDLTTLKFSVQRKPKVEP